MTDQNANDVLAAIEKFLRAHPEGLSELQLIRQLRDILPASELVETAYNGLALFRRHFLLFHYLYRLQILLWHQQAGHLQISPLCIQLLPYRAGPLELTEDDPLRDYYLELDHLDSTSKTDVEAMLQKFWQRFRNPAGRKEALCALGLVDPVDDAEIKRRYRKLAMEHHPDRGGSTDALQVINAAIRVLLG